MIYCLVRVPSSFYVVSERALRSGPAAVGGDVSIDDEMGERRRGYIVAIGTKTAMQSEKERMESHDTDDGAVSVRSTRSMSSSSRDMGSPSPRRARRSSPSATTARPDTPCIPKGVSSRGMNGRGRGRGSRASAGLRPVIPPTPITPMQSVPMSTLPSGSSSSLLSSASFSTSIGSPLSMAPPPGISLMSSLPPTQPVFSSQDPIVSHLLTEVSRLNQSVGAMMNMINNMFISWNDIILQTANKATAVHSEMNGTKDKLEEMANTIEKVETVVNKLAESTTTKPVFQYSPYSTKEDVDEIDTSQTLTKFTSRLEKLVYNEANPTDFSDIHKNFKDKENKAKAKWMIDCIINRRLISGGGDIEGTKSTIVRQLNENAGKRRRAVEATVQRNEKSLRIRSKRAYNQREAVEEGDRMEMGDDDDEGGRWDRMQRESGEDDIDIIN